MQMALERSSLGAVDGIKRAQRRSGLGRENSHQLTPHLSRNQM
jgi:hypothetical protein